MFPPGADMRHMHACFMRECSAMCACVKLACQRHIGSTLASGNSTARPPAGRKELLGLILARAWYGDGFSYVSDAWGGPSWLSFFCYLF